MTDDFAREALAVFARIAAALERIATERENAAVRENYRSPHPTTIPRSSE